MGIQKTQSKLHHGSVSIWFCPTNVCVYLTHMLHIDCKQSKHQIHVY